MRLAFLLASLALKILVSCHTASGTIVTPNIVNMNSAPVNSASLIESGTMEATTLMDKSSGPINPPLVTERIQGGSFGHKVADSRPANTLRTGTVLEPRQVFDYIVVGGGTAGLAVAGRLSEDPGVSVAVIEAGPNAENLPDVFIPGMTSMGSSFAALNWAYQTVPQDHLGSRNSSINAGKALGGGTIINSMIFTTGERGQYDAWGTLNNDDPNWTWDALLPYFKKSEILSPPNEYQIASGARYDKEFHGTSSEGRVKVGFPNYFFPQSALWRKATGFTPSPDLLNGKPQGTVGLSFDSIDAQNNTRCSSACAYYTPVADRPNLTVLTEVLATRLLWRRSSSPGARPRAIGVEFRSKDGQTDQLHVRKEVILSAGAIGSPKILELSGVGNANILRSAGVETVLDLPTVGENLADHVHSWANAFTTAPLTRDSLSDPDFQREQKELWYHNRTGLLSAVPRSLSLAVPSQLYEEPQDQLTGAIRSARNNLRHYAEAFSNGNANLAKGIERQHTIVLEAWEQDQSAPVELNFEPGYAGPDPRTKQRTGNFSSINAVLVGPLSRGRTHILSADPQNPPAVDPAYYAHPLDLATHVKGIQLGRRMLRAPPLDSIYDGEYQPGEDTKTDEDVAEWTTQVSRSDNHVTGSLAMMAADLGGVVDSRLRVYGLDNVRVVDASIIPFPISAHLVSTVYMIAERAVDFIKEDSHLHPSS